MLVEGRGNVAPAPVSVVLSRGEVLDAANEAQRRRGFRRYDDRPDEWGRGLIKDPIFVGLCGERGFAKWANGCLDLGVSADVSLRSGGDGGRDFVVFGCRLDVKTRRQKPRGQLAKNLVRVTAKDGRRVPIQCDAFVFAEWEREARTVHLLGWIRSAELQRIGRRERGVGGHHNLRALDRDLECMSRLAERIELAREWGAAS